MVEDVCGEKTKGSIAKSIHELHLDLAILRQGSDA